MIGSVTMAKVASMKGNKTLYNCITGCMAPDWSRFERFEVAPVSVDDDGCCDQCPPWRADRWTVYGWCYDGMPEAITDATTRRLAERIAELFEGKRAEASPWLRCPAGCGNSAAAFTIEACAVVRVTRNSALGRQVEAVDPGAWEYYPESLVTCSCCGHMGELQDFEL